MMKNHPKKKADRDNVFKIVFFYMYINESSSIIIIRYSIFLRQYNRQDENVNDLQSDFETQ